MFEHASVEKFYEYNEDGQLVKRTELVSTDLYSERSVFTFEYDTDSKRLIRETEVVTRSRRSISDLQKIL